MARGRHARPAPWRDPFLWAAAVLSAVLLPGTVSLTVPGTGPAAAAHRAARTDAATRTAPEFDVPQPTYDEPSPAPNPQAPAMAIASSPFDLADPFIVDTGGLYYLFTSSDAWGTNVPVVSGPVIGQWGPVTDALPSLPAWAELWAWAPDVHRFGDHYVMYFTTLLNGVQPSTMCIGDAVSTTITGPYTPAPAPFICQQSQAGSIDARTFVGADGQPYLLWKSDENAQSLGPTHIYSQRLSADGLHLLGQPSEIFAPDEPWQGSIVEAPDMVQVGGGYYLFYSGAWFNQPQYAIGVADCAGPMGPCADTSSSPLVSSNAQGLGPGEESVFSDAAGIWLLYSPFHSWIPDDGPPRWVAMARLGFGPFGPYLGATPATLSGA